ncbi:MAG: AAA family ATPase [Acidimicrobiales bacterium]
MGGVAATLLELVEIDPGWEGAFEAAAGPALGAVIVSGGGAGARRCLELLRDSGPGTVLGLGIERPAPAPPVVGEAVRAHVQGRSPDVDRLLDALVGGAVCVGGPGPSAWTEALDTVVAHPGAVVVTLAGDRFAAEGWRVGGRATGATRAAIEDARVAAAAAADAARAGEEGLRRAKSRLEAARAVEAEGRRDLHDRGAVLVTTTDAVERMEREARTTVAELEEARTSLAELQATVEGERRRSAELTAALPDLEAEEHRWIERREELGTRRHSLQERAGAVAALRTDVEVKAAALADRRAWLDQRLAEVDARLSRDQAQRGQAQARRAQTDARLRATDRLAAVVAGRVSELETALAGLRERRDRTTERARAGSERLDGLRRRRVAAEQELEQLRERSVSAGMEAQELALRAEAAAEALRRDLEVDPGTAAAAPCPPLPDGTTAAARARDLERELRQLGPVNPLALDEANLLRERQAFLDGQLDDVKTSRRELSKVIRAVDAEIVEVFVAAFADVSENFARLFAMLFPGGQGRLELTDPGNPLETGIRVRARPSGKNVRSVSLLSGGERSLTALAYLFAVFRSRPSPFYVLDEVEASLDDVNLHRFLDLMHEFRREAQLLVVSHQQRTMETADVLYGVTMAPGGASGVVSERVTATAG